MKILLTVIAFAFLFPLVIIIAVLTYFGFMPGLSSVFKTNQPANLGITYTPEDFASYKEKTKETFVSVPLPANPADSLKLEGTRRLEGTFTGAEITSRLAGSRWAYMPLTSPQVRFRPGGFEFSGNLNTGALGGFISTIGGLNYTSEDITKGLKLLGVLPLNPPVYGSVDASVDSNSVTLSVKSLTVGKIPVPLSSISADENFTKLTDHILQNAPGFSADRVRFEDNALIFTGSVPEKITVGTR